jgi:hypothetical protein
VQSANGTLQQIPGPRSTSLCVHCTGWPRVAATPRDDFGFVLFEFYTGDADGLGPLVELGIDDGVAVVVEIFGDFFQCPGDRD